MRSLIALALAVVLPAFVQAQNPTGSNEEVLAQAEAAFERGVENKTKFLLGRKDFSEASNRYLELHHRGVRTAALYRSLGNAAVLADRWPEAIWAYTIGLALDPNEAAMREHLAFARSKVLYPPSGEGRLDADAWPAWLHRPRLVELFWTFVLAYSLALPAVALAWLERRAGAKRLSTVAAVTASVAFVVALAAGAGLWHQQRQANLDRETPAVIIADNTPLYIGNAASYPRHATLPMLPRGMEARQIHARGHWLQVRLSTGEIGWLPRNRVLIVQ